MIGLLARLLRWFPDTWRDIDARARRTAAGGAGYDSRVAQILVVTSLVLLFEWYYGDRPFFQEIFGRRVAAHPIGRRYLELLAFCWWSAAKVVGFLLVPLVHVRLLGGRLRDYGMPLSAAADAGVPGRSWGRTYLLLYLAVLPLLIGVSFTRAFQDTYPFYRLAGRSWLDFLGWELQYGATFLCVEFFFRGYLLFGLRPALGSHAIFVMVVPYCLIHVLKPAAEAAGAIVAGVVLGTLALATGSIWCGVLIHVSVAWTMDLLAALQTHGLPRAGHFLP